MKENSCVIGRFYRFIGKKWSYMLFINIKENKEYSYEDFISATNRRISRSILSNFLCEGILLKLIEKKGKRYVLTKHGIKIKKSLESIKPILFDIEVLDQKSCNYLCQIKKDRF